MEYHFPPSVPRWKSLRKLPQILNNPIPVFNEFLADFGDTYTFNFRGSKVKGIFSINPEFHRHVLQKNNRNYKKSDVQVKWLGHYLGQNLLTSEGEYWLRQRRLIQPGFHRQRLASITGIINGVIDDFMIELERKMERDNTVDIAEETMELAFLIVAKSLFNTSLGMNQLNDLSSRITTLQQFLVKQIRLPFLNGYFKWTGQLRKHEIISREAEKIVEQVILERQASNLQRDDLLQMLLDARYEDTGEGMTTRQLLDETKILFVAGHETTANALAWTMYLLARYPDALDRVRAEVKEVSKKGSLQAEDLRNLHYTTQVIEESMRMYPPAWITDRMSLGDDECLGYRYPKGTMIGVYIYGTHHNPRLWDAPHEFRPERFRPEAKKNRPPYAYFPFGGGPRLCIGNNFAMMEMQLSVAKLTAKFDFDLVPGQNIVPHPLVTLRPQNGIKMRLRTR